MKSSSSRLIRATSDPLAGWGAALVLASLCAALAVPASAQTPAPSVVIVEVVPAKNNTTIPDEDGAFPAVIILRNTSPTNTPANLTVNLAGWFLSDDPANPTKWQFPERTLIAPQAQLIVFASGKDRRPPAGDGRLHTSFSYPCDVPFAGLYNPNTALQSEFSKPDPTCAEECRGVSVFNSDTLARFLVPKDNSFQTDWMQPGFDDDDWERGTLGIGYDVGTNRPYAGLIGTDVRQQMHNVNPSIFIRIPFTVENPDFVGKLDLGLHYDDGFVCYLNGVEVARRNAPVPTFPPFDSSSISNRTDQLALTPEVISLTGKIGLLLPGRNVLAIHGLNSSRDATRFVVRPDLCLEEVETKDCPQTTSGRDFWLAFPGNAPDDADNPLHLTVCITGVPGTTGVVEAPGLQFQQTFTIPANGPVAGTGSAMVELPPEATLDDSDVVERKGIHIRADRDVSVYATSRIDYSTDTFLALPTPWLGRKYIALGYKNVWRELPILNGTQFAIVGVFDGTRVRIDPSKTTTGGAPFEITLNQGETYLVRNTENEPADLSGALIDSTLPVGVFAGHRCANINGQDIFFCNIALEQILPISTWGTDYLAAPLRTRTHSVGEGKGDTLRVVAAQDGTAVTITDDTGPKNINLNAGQVHEQLVIGPSRVVARAPVHTALYSNSSDFDQVVNSDPFMSLIQPVPGWLSRYLICAPPTLGGTNDFEESYVNIIARNTAEAALIELNGAPVAGFQPAGSLGFVYAQVRLDPTQTEHLIESPRGATFGVTVYGFSEFDAYGYPAGFGSSLPRPATIVCPPEVVINLEQGCEAPAPDIRRNIRVIDPCEDGGEPPPPVCFEFEDLQLGTEFRVGQTFTITASGQSVPVTVAPFVFSNGQSTTNGTAIVRNNGQAGHTGNEIQVNNVNLRFDPPAPWPGVSILYGEFGGNINLAVNGDFRNAADFTALNGATIGGAQVTVIATPGNPRGEIRITGTVSQFAIGGQELFIDHLCTGEQEPPAGGCFEFEDLRLGLEIRVGDSVTTRNAGNTEAVTIEGHPFTFSDGRITTNGVATVVNGGDTGHTGNEFQVNNIQLFFKPNRTWPGFSILYGEFGGNVNLVINGELRNAADFSQLNGMTIGGAQVTVVAAAGSARGEIRVTGSVRDFAIGGQELFIDHLCVPDGETPPPTGGCFEFEDVKLETELRVGSTGSTRNAGNTETISIQGRPFTFSNGQTTTNGVATVVNGGDAGHSGNEFQVNNIQLLFTPQSPWPGFSILYGEFGGNVNLVINGELRNAADFSQLNGMTIGGVQVTVLAPVGSARGEIRATGSVRDFAIGGQELFIDHLCVPEQSTPPPVIRGRDFPIGVVIAPPSSGFVVTQNPPPGTPLPAGENEIVVTVRNREGRLIGSCVTIVRVDDPSPVKLECPQEIRVQCQDPRGARVFYDVRAVTERCGQVLRVECKPPSGSLFPPGTTTVQCVVPGRNAQCTFLVHVECPTTGPRRVSIGAIQGRRIQLNWETGGTLETAPTVTGPWRPVSNFRSGDMIEATDGTAFFRVRFGSNPP